MAEIQFTPYLKDVMAYAKTIGTKPNPPFTAERFLLAIMGMDITKFDAPKAAESMSTESLLQRHISNLDSAKKLLTEQIFEGKSTAFEDDLYMREMLQAAQKMADGGRVSAVMLLKCILAEPNAAIYEILVKLGDEAGGDSNPSRNLFEPIDEPDFGPFQVRPTKPDDNQLNRRVHKVRINNSSGENNDTQMTMSTLVSDVKRIRKELSGVVFGQDNAVNTFVTGYFQSGLLSMIDKSRVRPRATFLFAGPPGVGKTFLAEKAAAALKLPFMRFDMSEYADSQTAAEELSGYPESYKGDKPGKATTFVAKHPKCILLFDEIEKACIEVIHLFLQLLDAGVLRDANMKKEISFKDVIIIFTTNAGKPLYEDSDLSDFSAVPRKVVIRALQKDVNPKTGNPYFPAAMCSRFASGNVVMFNHMSASFLRAIAKNEIQRHVVNLKREMGMELLVDEAVYTALLFSEGASVDARMIRGRAEAFFNDELYELLRLVASDEVKASVEDIETVHISVDLSHAKPDVLPLFETNESVNILVFADEATVAACREKLPSFRIIGVQDMQASMEALRSNEISFVLLDMRCGAPAEHCNSLNLEDVESPARDVLRMLRQQKSELPVYLLEKEDALLTEEERVSFTRQGVRGVLPVSDEDNSFAGTVAEIATGLHQLECMTQLAKANKLVSFETAQSISADGKQAEIRLFDLAMEVAIDSEDSKNVLSAVSKPNVTFDDVIGAKEAKKELAYFVEYLKNPKKYMGTGVKAPKGVLLYGPPGTGKTMLAKAMAKESDVTFIAAEGNQFLKKYTGEGPETVHELFRTARKYAPSILFVDEIDAVAKERRGEDSSGVEETLTAFLAEMDGFSSDPSKPVFVLAATNFDVESGRAKSLDPALMRRFDRRVYIELPGREERIKFMRMKIQKTPAFEISDAQIENIAMRSTGMSLANLDSAMELALRSAIREGSTKVTDAIFEEAFETFNSGEAKKWDASHLKRTARHEAGHAFVCWYGGETPSYLTIVARGDHGGYMQYADNEGKGTYTKEELLAKIKTALGGRASEIVYYGEKDGISTGASGDLASATNTARHMLCSYGMDDEFGLAAGMNESGAMSLEVHKAVNRILKEQMEEAVRIINENKDKVDALVDALLKKNYLNSEEIEQVLTTR